MAAGLGAGVFRAVEEGAQRTVAVEARQPVGDSADLACVLDGLGGVGGDQRGVDLGDNDRGRWRNQPCLEGPDLDVSGKLRVLAQLAQAAVADCAQVVAEGDYVPVVVLQLVPPLQLQLLKPVLHLGNA